jgi:hypothetical protein
MLFEGSRDPIHGTLRHDHNRIDRMLFEGSRDPIHGTLRPDLTRPGHGMAFKTKDAQPYLSR